MRYWHSRVLSILAIAVSAWLNSACAQDQPAQPLRLLVPAYFYPSGDGLKDWKRLLDAAAKTPIAAIVNPDSGPGKRRDPNYKELLRLAKGSKITLVGYVTLSYGQRPLSAVKADVDSWLLFYPEIRGIFFDEQPSQAELAPFALESFAYVRTKLGGGLMVTNPGVPCAREYLTGRDAPTACLFEHETGFERFRLPDWASTSEPRSIAVLLYHVKSTESMRHAVTDCIAKRAGYLYVTDAAGPAQWTRLPTYWEEEIRELIRINAAANKIK
jgi:Spherulation-specific family 4